MKNFGIVQGLECFETSNYVFRIDTNQIYKKNDFFSVQWVSKSEGKVRTMDINFEQTKNGQLRLKKLSKRHCKSLIEAIKLCLSENKGIVFC